MAKRTVDHEGLMQLDFWTNKFYNKAYEIVKDRKIPVVIPSYNRPNAAFFRDLHERMDLFDTTWPIIVIIRESQKDMYENSEYLKNKSYITIVSYPDAEIDSVGKVHNKIITEFAKKYEWIMMSDDDVFGISYSVKRQLENNKEKSQAILPKIVDFSRVMAMWQIATEYMQVKNNTILTMLISQGFCYNPKFTEENQSVMLLRNACPICCMVNLKEINNHGITYGNSLIDCGHDDLEFLLQVLDKKQMLCVFNWASWVSSPVSTMNGLFDSVQNRFKLAADAILRNHENKNYLKRVTKYEMDNIRVLWDKVRNIYLEDNIIKPEELIQNIWNGSRLLGMAKTNYEELKK